MVLIDQIEVFAKKLQILFKNRESIAGEHFVGGGGGGGGWGGIWNLSFEDFRKIKVKELL